MKRRMLLVLGGAGLIALGAIADYAWFDDGGPIPPPSADLAALSAPERAELVAHGRHVARAADCEACHVTPDGVALAGGLPMETPMGTIYGTNITPDPEHGIGDWSADDLYRALTRGIGAGGGHLYPAMPYTSYHAMSRADSDALWLWLMDQPAIARPDREADLKFPFNIRPALAFWNFAFAPDATALPAIPGKAEAWQRGRYLVDVLGHCGECHTPRNFAFAMTDEHLKGEVIEGATAPDISPEGLASRGWTPDDLVRFLGTGLAPQGTMTFRMFPVLNHSTRHLGRPDLEAMAAYLMDGAPPPTAPPARPEIVADAAFAEGHKLYLGLCAGCHGSEGEGQPHASIPLAGNTTAMLDDPRNLVRIIREGVPARRLAGNERMQEMPPFADRLTPSELTSLVNYLRARWGGREPVSEERVAEIEPM